MNFLPIEHQALLKKQYRKKFFVFLGFIILFLAITNLILIIPSHLFLKTSGTNNQKLFEIVKQNPVFLSFSNMNLSLERLNSEIEFLDKQKQEVRHFTPVLKRIIDLKTDGVSGNVSIDFILFEKKADKITFRGKADTRADLLRFIKNLEKEESFLEIQSPPSNLLKERDIDYLLTIFLK